MPLSQGKRTAGDFLAKKTMPTSVLCHEWGDNLNANSAEQMWQATRLPVATGATADASVGHGLPIGEVFAIDNAVIP